MPEFDHVVQNIANGNLKALKKTVKNYKREGKNICDWRFPGSLFFLSPAYYSSAEFNLLMVAVAFNQLELVNYFIEQEIDPAENGNIALSLAISANFQSIWKLLLSCPAVQNVIVNNVRFFPTMLTENKLNVLRTSLQYSVIKISFVKLITECHSNLSKSPEKAELFQRFPAILKIAKEQEMCAEQLDVIHAFHHCMSGSPQVNAITPQYKINKRGQQYIARDDALDNDQIPYHKQKEKEKSIDFYSIRYKKFPLLASGKTDYVKLEKLLAERNSV